MIPDTSRSHYGICPYDQAWAAFVAAITIACFCDPDFDVTWPVTFALIIVTTHTLRESPEITFGFWSEEVTAVYDFHKGIKSHPYLWWVNLVFIILALYACKEGAKFLRPHMSTWVLPKPEDMSFITKLKGGAAFYAFAVLCPVLLSSWPLLSSMAFIAVVSLYMIGFVKLGVDVVEHEKTKKAAVSVAVAAKSTKGGISISTTTHSRVNQFWTNHMFPREELTKKQDFKTFTMGVTGHPAIVRNNKILDLFKETLQAAGHVVTDNR